MLIKLTGDIKILVTHSIIKHLSRDIMSVYKDSPWLNDLTMTVYRVFNIEMCHVEQA